MKNDYAKLMESMNSGMINLNSTINTNGKATIKRVAEAEKNISKGLANVNSTINMNGKAAIAQTRKSEERIVKKIESIKGVALSTLDYVCILIVTVLAGFCGWLFSKTMIAHEFSPWVDRTATDIYDALGNYSSTNVTTETVWVTVILTVVLFAIVGMMLAYTVVSDLREKEG